MDRPGADRIAVLGREGPGNAAGGRLLGPGLAALWPGRLADRLAGQPGRRPAGSGPRLRRNDLRPGRRTPADERWPHRPLSSALSAPVPHGVQRRWARVGLQLSRSGREPHGQEDRRTDASAPGPLGREQWPERGASVDGRADARRQTGAPAARACRGIPRDGRGLQHEAPVARAPAGGGFGRAQWRWLPNRDPSNMAAGCA